ncbi:MAG: hypothetical protein Crog4KO_12920 [Crocinitomicaceae bacterium]
MLLANVNELRDSLGIEPLKEQPNLQKAALDHSKYMAKNKVLTHDEKGPGRTVAKRVRRAGSRDFDIVGENVLFTEVDNFKFKKQELEELARSMYLQWRNSPGHFRNMIQEQYEFGDIGISADSKSKRIYATQVFGSEGARVEGQLSKNAFGIRASREECSGIHDNLLTNMCNGIGIRNDTVFFHYHDIGLVKQFLTGMRDGFAIDLIDREQMACGGPNILDMSKVYDGIMLEPVYRDEVFRRNTAEGENRLITFLGVVPEPLRGKSLALGMIYIKNGEMCMYSVPAYSPSRAYVLEPFEPELIRPNIPLVSNVIYSEELNFNFERGSIQSSNRPELSAFDADSKVHSLQILSYSSVEGSTQNNINLHHERARFIESYIRKKTNGQNYPTDVDAQENWRKMDFQLRYLFADSLLDLTHQELKAVIASGDTSLDWEKLLFEQRSSRAFINYSVNVDPVENKEALPALNLTTAILQNNMDLANQALYDMYHSDYLELSIYSEQIFDALLKRKELVQNAAALFSKDYQFDRTKATMFVHAWASRLNELDQKAKENVLHLYSLLGYGLVQEWDVSAKRLSNVIHPTRLEGLINNSLPKEILLNVNLTFVYYYGHTLEQEGLERSFAFVKEYMEKKSFTEQQLTNLVLFFNDWSRYDLTNEYLIKSFDNGVISDKNVFILAHTLSKYQSGKYHEKYLKVMRKALSIDAISWCGWVDTEFQILRDLEIKQMYCESCP